MEDANYDDEPDYPPKRPKKVKRKPLPPPASPKDMQDLPKYMRSEPIRPILHPVDSNLACSFLLSVLFVAVSLVTGFPLVAALSLLLPVALFARHMCIACCPCTRSNRSTWRQGYELLSSVDAYWLHDSQFNEYVAHCLFFLEGEVRLGKLKTILLHRLVNRAGEGGDPLFPRFTQKVVPLSAGYGWMDDDRFNIDKHVLQETQHIRTKKELASHLGKLMKIPLRWDRPLWEMRVLSDFGKSHRTVLIVRVHHALTDGISLVKIFGSCLADAHPVTQLKPRFGGTAFPLNVFRAVVVAPWTFLTWLVLGRKDYNLFSHKQTLSGTRTVAWSDDIDLHTINRVKQVTRSSLNDVVLTALSGALRAYFRKCGIINPPDVTVSMPVDLRYEPMNCAESVPDMGTRYALVNSKLPINTEGAIPRLWETRHLMEELKTSADPVVMYGLTHFLLSLLPERVAQWLLGSVHSKASCVYSNLPGPEQPIYLASKKLSKAMFWMAPRSDIPLSLSVLTYGGRLFLTVAADHSAVPDPVFIVNEFYVQIELLSSLLSKRRLPGEIRRRSAFNDRRREEEILKPSLDEIQRKLYAVQDEVHDLTQKLEACGDPASEEYEMVIGLQNEMRNRLEELKEEFAEILTELRRRKSIADGCVINIEDDDMEGEVRKFRKRALSVSARRSSFAAVTSIMSSARPLTTPNLAAYFNPSSDPHDSHSPSPDQQRRLITAAANRVRRISLQFLPK